MPDRPLLYDLERLRRETPTMAEEFRSNAPFPHLVIDDLTSLTPDSVDQAWPSREWTEWVTLDQTYSANKLTCDDVAVIPDPLAELIRQLNEPRFLRVLEEISGIPRLLPDPHLVGGGLHMSGPGGVLNPHTDFHHHRGLEIYRRLNVLVYFNTDWTVEDGGCLSLFDKATDRAVRTVVPAFSRAVVFQTDDQSVHGFPEPIVEGKWRRSVALYYYTAADTTTFSGDATTYWRETSPQRGVVRRVRLGLYRVLLNASRSLSVLAHLVNPNQGVGLFRSVWQNRRRVRRR